MQEIRVVLADDHALLLEGLERLIEEQDDITVVGRAESGDVACELANRLEPDIVVMDYTMPGTDGITAARRLADSGLATKVLFLSMHANIHYVLEAMSAGAFGYVVKTSASFELVQAIRTVHDGRHYISRSLDEQVAKQMSLTNNRRGIAKLSQREFELMRHLGAGRTLQEASRLMGVSDSTASTYRHRLMTKLGLSNTAQIIRYALENGIVD